MVIYLVKETIDYKSDIETPVYVTAFKDYDHAVEEAKRKYDSSNIYMNFTEDEEYINANFKGYTHEAWNANDDYYHVTVEAAELKD